MIFNSPHSPISLLQSVLTKLQDVLPAKFFNIDWEERGIVNLMMISDKIMQFFDCSKIFWLELSEFQEKKLDRIDSRKLSISKEFQLLATNKPI